MKKKRHKQNSRPAVSAVASLGKDNGRSGSATNGISSEVSCQQWGRIWPALLLILAVSLVVRLIAIGRPELWGDEVLFVGTSNAAMTPGQVFSFYWSKGIVSLAWLPLPALIQNIYMRTIIEWAPGVMRNPFLLRLPGAMFGSLGVVAVFFLSRSILKKYPAMFATAMTCVFLFPIYYSREALSYPLVLLLAPLSFLFFYRSLFDSRNRIAGLIALFVCLLLLVYSHLTCVFLLGAFCLASAALLAWRLRRGSDRGTTSMAIQTALVCGLTVVLISPVFYKILTQGNPHLAQDSGIAFYSIIHHGISKLFMGNSPPMAAAAWILLISGFISMAAPGEKRIERITFAGVTALAMLLIAAAAYRTQYASARYFAPIAPALYLVIAEGIWFFSGMAVSRMRKRPGSRTIIFGLISACCLLTHFFLFLPPMYRMEAKMIPFGKIAQWLNANMPAGTPYTFHCGGWDLRYVPGYYATPGLTPVVRVAWNGPDYFPTVRTIQEEMMSNFPHSAFIEAVNDSVTDWDKPRRFYRNKVEFPNEPLDALVGRGAWFAYSDSDDYENYYNILYNTQADVEQMARDAGEPTLFGYHGWEIAEINREEYARVSRERAAACSVKNLLGNEVSGRFSISGACVGGAGKYEMEFRWQGKTILRTWQQPGVPWSVETEEVQLPSGEHLLAWTARADSGSPSQAHVLFKAAFIPSSDHPDSALIPPAAK